jgi:hypothetical protein
VAERCTAVAVETLAVRTPIAATLAVRTPFMASLAVRTPVAMTVAVRTTAFSSVPYPHSEIGTKNEESLILYI